MKQRLLIAVLVSLCLSGCDEQGPHSIKPVASLVTHQGLANYEIARKAFWRSLYPGRVNSLYCGEVFNSAQRRGYNVEHVFPMSWATNGLQCGNRKQCRQNSAEFNRIEADLHNLYPARVDINKERSSYRFGIVNGEKRAFGRCDFEVDYRARAVEPTEAVRGEVARTMFYMAYRYKDQGLVLFDKQASLLIKWHQNDPPNKEEARRNNVIEQLQGNRNPFVDEPERLNKLYHQGYFSRR